MRAVLSSLLGALLLACLSPCALRADGTVVAQDGSGSFRSIQEAINAAPQLTSAAETWTIRIRPGVYRELIYVMREKRFVRLLGDDPATTVIVNGLYAGIPGQDGQPIGTFRTPTVWVDADDFSIERVTISNDAGRVGQALALRIDGERVAVRQCRLLGWQDTLLCNRGRQYFERCEIRGAVDFIFGGATAYFDRCDIVCEGDGFITAASTLPYDTYGLVFSHCRVRGVSPELRTYLGRPWRAFAAVMFLHTEMGEVVRPEGWNNWERADRERSARYFEGGSRGPGARPEARVSWARQPDTGVLDGLGANQVLGGRDGWAPASE